MIVADRKSIPEIREMIKDHDRVLLTGCGTCVTVCLAGGEREVGILGSALRMALQLIGRGAVVVDECTIERQCEDAFLDILAPKRRIMMPSVHSAAAPAYKRWRSDSRKGHLSGLNTQFIGILESQGVWTEKCIGCGNCRLGEFAGICPITRCAKHLFNGPCGGARQGKCEVNAQRECAWQLIYDRTQALGISEQLAVIAPPQDWSIGIDGGPRKVVREDQCIAGLRALPEP